jgi:hypothetical protein
VSQQAYTKLDVSQLGVILVLDDRPRSPGTSPDTLAAAAAAAAVSGRIFIYTGPKSAEEVPIFFALIQACTADGRFPTTPEARAMPLLGQRQ